ncbi:GLPGLI family protein [soil metagenome]
MKKILLIIPLVFLSQLYSRAQQFIDEAVIEYEVVSNIQKTMGNNTWAEMLKENLPKFKTGYFTYTFSGNKSIYKFDHWAPQKIPKYMLTTDEESSWYYDFENDQLNMKKLLYGSEFTLQQPIYPLKWKLTNENRVIAGFNCRKAVTTIFDSVYVFAFYTDEILISGGPCSVHGLPGMILGMTIPRLYTSWIATKVMVNNVNKSQINPITATKYFTKNEIESTLEERMKDWYSDDPADNAEIQQQKARMVWLTLL